MTDSTLPKGLVAKIHSINEFDLPLTTGMVSEAGILGNEYHNVMVADLKDRANDGDQASLWALEQIVNLYRNWVDSSDRLHDIQEVIDRKHKYE